MSIDEESDVIYCEECGEQVYEVDENGMCDDCFYEQEEDEEDFI